jgi:hypothetical protein
LRGIPLSFRLAKPPLYEEDRASRVPGGVMGNRSCRRKSADRGKAPPAKIKAIGLSPSLTS